MKKFINCSVAVLVLTSSIYAGEVFSKPSMRDNSTIVSRKNQSKKERLKRKIAKIDKIIEGFKGSIDVYVKDLEKAKEFNRKIKELIRRHFALMDKANSDNKYNVMAIRMYEEESIGESLLELRNKIRDRIRELEINLEDAKNKIDSIPVYQKVRESFRLQLQVIDEAEKVFNGDMK